MPFLFDAITLGAILAAGGTGVTLTNVVLDNNTADYQGGAIYSSNPLTINSSSFTSNTILNQNLAGGGAGIFQSGSTMDINNTTFDGNDSASRGGAMRIENMGDVDINTSFIISNEAGDPALDGGAGGGIYINDSTVDITITTITGNNVDGPGGPGSGSGGGIYNLNGDVLIAGGGTVSNNTTQQEGGAIANFGTQAELDINGGTLNGNDAFWGGAIYNDQGTVNIFGLTTINDNEVRTLGLGGAIYSTDSPAAVTINGATLNNNRAASPGSSGGAIFNWVNSTLTLQNSFVTNNIATSVGGGLYNTGGAEADITNTEFSGNQASDGGAVYLGSGTVIIGGSLIENNTASEDSGGIFNDGTLTVTGSRFLENTASPATGGAYYHQGGTTNATNNCFVGNSDSPAVFNETDTAQAFTGNWWGAVDGPGGVGPGSGDTVGADIDFAGFLAADNLDCGGVSQQDDDDDDDEDPTATPTPAVTLDPGAGGVTGGTPTPTASLPGTLPNTGGRPVPPYALIGGVMVLLAAVSAGALMLRGRRA